MRRRRRKHSILIAGLFALLAALGLIAIVSLSNNPLTNLEPTTHQQTVDAIVRTRLALTAEMRTLAAMTEAPSASETPEPD